MPDRLTTTTSSLLTTADLACRWRTTEQGVYAARYRGDCPPAVHVGRRLLWRLADVEAWESRHIETDPPPRPTLPWHLTSDKGVPPRLWSAANIRPGADRRGVGSVTGNSASRARRSPESAKPSPA
ncbi:MAG: hypothetical protein ACRD0J_09910 [Acidimicrobiales bacterium]